MPIVNDVVCDRCFVRQPREQEGRLPSNWLGITDYAPAGQPNPIWTFCSWKCVGLFGWEREKEPALQL